MPKRTVAQHWQEMRYHMIAGGIYYLLGLVTWGGVTQTFAFLRAHLGTTTSVLIDIGAVLAIFLSLVALVRLWKSTKVSMPPPDKLKIVQVSADNSADEKIKYKAKVRIAVRNDTPDALDICNPFWIANGDVALELPPQLQFQKEKGKGGWQGGQWINDESREIHVQSGETFRTWIGLREQLSENAFSRKRESRQFGTLALSVRGYDEELRLAI